MPTSVGMTGQRRARVGVMAGWYDRFIEDLSIIRRRRVVGGRGKPGHGTHDTVGGTLLRAIQPTRLCLGVALRLTHALGGQGYQLAHHVTKHGLPADPDIRGDRHAGHQMEVWRGAVQLDLIQADSGAVKDVGGL